MGKPAIALTIAGSDPGGGAGLQADLKIFHQLEVYGTSVVTLITVQNTRRASRVELLDPRLVAEQIGAVLEDLPPQAAKTGALGSAAIIEAVASCGFACPLVVDPVTVGKHGGKLLAPDAILALKELLLPKAALVTPNADEAAVLSGREVSTLNDRKDAAERIARLGCGSVLIKGGHAEATADGRLVDLLFDRGEFIELAALRIETRHTHGTGCVYSAAITALLARGEELRAAVAHAHAFVHEAIRTNPGLGAGSGPLNHWVRYNSDSNAQ